MQVFPGINLQDVISFQLHSGAKATIPTSFDNVKLVAVLDADTAKSLIDPITLHRNVYPALPVGTCPDDAFAYNYIKVQLADGNYTAVGLPFVDQTTLVKHESTTAELRVHNVQTTDLQRLKDHLAAGGFYLVEARMV